jgi:Glyoxalase-like domain
MGALVQIIFDCERAPALARFWAALLDGYRVRAYDDAEIARLAALGFTPETDPIVLVDGPGPSLCFQQVVEPRRERGRLHVDIAVTDRAREVERVRALGGSVVRETSDYTVMSDPEGNRFCIAQAR